MSEDNENTELVPVKSELPKDLHKALKMEAARSGLYQKIVIKKAIKEYLEKRDMYNPKEE